jgi:hypothetical protein
MIEFFEYFLSILQNDVAGGMPTFYAALERELVLGLTRYWEIAGRILRDSGVTLLSPPKEYTDLSRNFFSLLFLYSLHRGDIPSERRVFYVTINQCLRGMVTGCDNLLDDEYKRTLETDLPERGTRIRSVLDIMVSDRVLFELLMDEVRNGQLPMDRAVAASAVSLRALTESAAQEASEEGGVQVRLSPEDVLTRVHHYKTAILFQCIWAVPQVIETLPEAVVSTQKRALYQIGIGCQILDDMVDLAADVQTGRHNYVASLINHASSEAERETFAKWAESIAASELNNDLLWEFPVTGRIAAGEAIRFLTEGLSLLFMTEHKELIDPSIRFIASRIGADHFLSAWSE